MRKTHTKPSPALIVAVQHERHFSGMTNDLSPSIFTPPPAVNPNRPWLLRALDRWLELQHRVVDFGLRQD